MSDGTFDAGWLALREPVDHRSRAAGLAETLARAGAARDWHRVVDLGGGAGSNVRYLAPRLPWARSWVVVDHDAALLDRIAAPAGAALERRVTDLDAPDGLDPLETADVVAASALLDLVSRAWLERLVARCAAREAGVLLALSYDGTVEWDPTDVDDRRVLDAVNRHQLRNKGLGAALGPRAGRLAGTLLTRAGYEVRSAPSPWVLRGEADAPLARALMDGWVEAAAEVAPDDEARFRRWRERRGRAWADEAPTLTVGHVDVLALPRDDR